MFAFPANLFAFRPFFNWQLEHDYGIVFGGLCPITFRNSGEMSRNFGESSHNSGEAF